MLSLQPTQVQPTSLQLPHCDDCAFSFCICLGFALFFIICTGYYRGNCLSQRYWPPCLTRVMNACILTGYIDCVSAFGVGYPDWLYV